MTGPIQTGKTTWIRNLLAQPTGLRVGGVLCPAQFEDGVKTAILAQLIPGGEPFMYAPRREIVGEGGEHVFAGWDFQQSAFDVINEHFASPACRCADLLVVDEIGWLELFRGQGYTNAMDLLDRAAVPRVLTIIREDLVPAAEQRWGHLELLTPASPCTWELFE